MFVKRTLYDRTARLAANGEDAFSFTLCGHSFLVNGEKRVSSGGGFFLSHRQRFTVQASDDCYSCLLKVDRAALLELMPKGFDLHGKVFPANHATLPLIWDMVPLITSKTEPTTANQREVIGTQIIDLIALLLDPSRGGREQIEKRGLKEARKGAVLRAIDKHFARRELNADLIGRELDISGREVHRLLQETTKTFYEHLLERRLLHANELLHGGPDAKLKIADIAFQSGFADITHFNHAFRRRFGDTPTGVRSAVATERTLHYLRRTVDRPRQNS